MGTIGYRKLFALMKERGLSTYRIRKEHVIGEASLQSIREGRAVTTDTVAALCGALGCQPGDILEYLEDGMEDRDDTITSDKA